MIIHDLSCDCGHMVSNYVFQSANDVGRLPHCPNCGHPMSIHYNPSYRRQFSGSWNGLTRDKIVVFEGPDGRVEYPGRADEPMPDRYKQQGFVRRELAPFEVSAFEKKNGVICESLHWDNNGKVERESIPDRPQVQDFSYQELMHSE